MFRGIGVNNRKYNWRTSWYLAVGPTGGGLKIQLQEKKYRSPSIEVNSGEGKKGLRRKKNFLVTDDKSNYLWKRASDFLW